MTNKSIYQSNFNYMVTVDPKPIINNDNSIINIALTNISPYSCATNLTTALNKVIIISVNPVIYLKHFKLYQNVLIVNTKVTGIRILDIGCYIVTYTTQVTGWCAFYVVKRYFKMLHVDYFRKINFASFEYYAYILPETFTVVLNMNFPIELFFNLELINPHLDSIITESINHTSYDKFIYIKPIKTDFHIGLHQIYFCVFSKIKLINIIQMMTYLLLDKYQTIFLYPANIIQGYQIVCRVKPPNPAFQFKWVCQFGNKNITLNHEGIYSNENVRKILLDFELIQNRSIRFDYTLESVKVICFCVIEIWVYSKSVYSNSKAFIFEFKKLPDYLPLLRRNELYLYQYLIIIFWFCIFIFGFLLFSYMQKRVIQYRLHFQNYFIFTILEPNRTTRVKHVTSYYFIGQEKILITLRNIMNNHITLLKKVQEELRRVVEESIREIADFELFYEKSQLMFVSSEKCLNLEKAIDNYLRKQSDNKKPDLFWGSRQTTSIFKKNVIPYYSSYPVHGVESLKRPLSFEINPYNLSHSVQVIKTPLSFERNGVYQSEPFKIKSNQTYSKSFSKESKDRTSSIFSNRTQSVLLSRTFSSASIKTESVVSPRTFSRTSNRTESVVSPRTFSRASKRTESVVSPEHLTIPKPRDNARPPPHLTKSFSRQTSSGNFANKRMRTNSIFSSKMENIMSSRMELIISLKSHNSMSPKAEDNTISAFGAYNSKNLKSDSLLSYYDFDENDDEESSNDNDI